MAHRERPENNSYADVTRESIDRDVRDVSADDESSADGVRADAALVERCRAGEVAAWSEIYAQCHDSLLAAIKIMLGPQNGDLDLVDELAARVWYSLVANDGALLRKYNPKRSVRVITFLAALAKDQIMRYFRGERRRQKLEIEASHENAKCDTGRAIEPDASLSEFLLTLTPKERGFADQYLLAAAGPEEGVPDSGCGFSLSNIWQLTGRVRRKLLSFLKR